MDSNTIPANAKITICCKRTQDMKTTQCIHLIRHRIEEESVRIHALFARDMPPKPSIHYIFTMNTLLNNKQFSLRLKQIEELCGGKSKIVEFSSRKSGQYNHVSTARELKAMLLDPRECPRIVICCSNVMRFTDGETLMGDVDRIRGNEVRQFAYYDEMHKYIEQCRDKIKALCSLNSVKGILGLTATPAPIFIRTDPFWSKMFFMEVENLSGPNYCALADHEYKLTPSDAAIASAEQRVIAYIRATLAAHLHILDNGTYSFIPGVNVRRSHTAVRDAVWAVNPNAVVVTLNTNKVVEYITADRSISTWQLDGNKEVGDMIADMIACPKHNLADRPLVVTGFICIGMGQSLVCPALGTFTSIIASHEDLTNEDLYQLIGRGAAVSKGWATFRETRVYCPESTMQRCTTMEKVALSMSDVTRDDYVSLETLNAPMHADEAGKVTLAHIREKVPKKDAPPPEDMRMSIPIIVSVTASTIEEIHKSSTADAKQQKVLELLSPDAAALLRGYTCKQVTRPRADLQYQKAVADVVAAAAKGRRPGLFTKEEKKTNVWQGILDDRSNRIVVTFYRGV